MTYLIWDTVEKSYVRTGIKLRTKKMAEEYKELLLARGNYPDKPHTVYEIRSIKRDKYGNFTKRYY